MDEYSLPGWTKLHLAVDEDIDGAIQQEKQVTLETSKALIEAGADEMAQNAEGNTPRDIAAAYGEKALHLYDSISRIDWSGEPSLQEFTNRCLSIIASSGYDVRLLDSNHISIARAPSDHSNIFGHIFIFANQWYGWRRDPEFTARLVSAARDGLENIESKLSGNAHCPPKN